MSIRVPPHNEDAERSVLGAAMISHEAMMNAVEMLRPEDFYNRINKEIYEAIEELYKKNSPVDTITVSEELKRRGSLEMAGGRGYIGELTLNVPSTANAGEYARIIAEKSSLRSLIDVSADITDKGYDDSIDVDEILDYAERSVLEIGQKRQVRDFTPIEEVLRRNVDKISELAANEGKITGLTTGFLDIDNMLSGLQKSDMIIVAARPSMGKTAFAINIAQNAAVKGNASVLIFSLEMSKEQLGERILAVESRTELGKIKTGALEQKDWDRVGIAIDTLSKANIVIDDTPGISVMEMKNKCRRLKAEKGLDLIVIDYLQLMEYKGKSDNRQQEISALSRMIKQLAREMECPVIVLSQLSRGVEARTDKRPMMSDLRESGSIEQDADIVMMLYRDDYYNKESEKYNICEIIIAKHRNGATGTVELTWQPQFTKFSDKARSGGNYE